MTLPWRGLGLANHLAIIIINDNENDDDDNEVQYSWTTLEAVR